MRCLCVKLKKCIVTKSKFHKHLIDKSIAKMKLKPTDSLSILFHQFNHFAKEDEETCRNKNFNAKKYFIIVSKTKKYKNYPFNTNKSNSHMQKIIDLFKSFIRLEKFHYTNFIAINDKVFEEYISKYENSSHQYQN